MLGVVAEGGVGREEESGSEMLTWWCWIAEIPPLLERRERWLMSSLDGVGFR